MKDQSKTWKKTALLIGVMVLLLASAGAALLFSGSSSYKKIKNANTLLEAGDFSGARRVYESVLEKEPLNFSAHYGMGMSWCAGAILKTELGLAEPQDWYNAIYHMTVAGNLRKNEQAEKSLAAFYFNLGACFKRRGNPEAALPLMEQAVIFDPTLLKALNLLGAMYHERGNFEKAEYYYLQTKVKPDYPMAHFNLGALAWADEDYNLSATCFEKAVSLAPENEHFKTWLLKARKRLDEQ